MTPAQKILTALAALSFTVGSAAQSQPSSSVAGTGTSRTASTAPRAETEHLSPLDFEDVDWNAWYGPYVGPILYWGIASGYRDAAGVALRRFGPGDTVTVAQLLKMGMRAARINTNTCPGAAAPVAGEHWAMPYVRCAQGMNVRLFQKRIEIDRPILRGEAIALLHDVFGAAVPPLPSAFDDTRTHPYRSDIAYASARQVISGPTDAAGRPTGRFLPNDTLNRAEAAKMLYLLIHTEDIGTAELVHPAILELHVKNYKFSPSTLTVQQRQPVLLRFKSEGRHTFTVEALGINEILSKPEQTFTFVPNRAGTFPFFCIVPGHARAGMSGTLIVR